MPIERKLAAIMFTDIAGYTASMSKSESKSLDLLEKKRSILKPLIKEYNGTFVKEIGDGTLSYFESAVNASTCAVKLQEQTYNDDDMNIRAGIHIGDIVFKDAEDIEFEVNFRIPELLENKSCLETAYNQVQEKASEMADGKKFLSYPIPKAIVEAWKTLNKDNN